MPVIKGMPQTAPNAIRTQIDMSFVRLRCHCSGAIGYGKDRHLLDLRPPKTRHKRESMPSPDPRTHTRIGAADTEGRRRYW